MNQPPPTEQQTGKRIVSKGAYVAAKTRKTVWTLFSVFLLFAAIACALLTFVYGFYSLVCLLRVFWKQDGMLSRFVVYGVAALVLGYSARLLVGLSDRSTLKAEILESVIESVIPLTRANSADLPAPDSLVRASAEPMQESQAVLLRAATESVERHEEQLVRASAGGTEQA